MQPNLIHVEHLRLGDLVLHPACREPTCAETRAVPVVHLEEDADFIFVRYKNHHFANRYPFGAVVQVTHRSDFPDPIVPVRSITLPEVHLDWHISQDLSDRWGELNTIHRFEKPLEDLETNSALFERLHAQMFDEITFIVRKDGCYGILFEVELNSIENHRADTLNQDGRGCAERLQSYETVIAHIREEGSPLIDRYPTVDFAFPPPEEIYDGRSALWAFVRDATLDQLTLAALGRSLLELRSRYP